MLDNVTLASTDEDKYQINYFKILKGDAHHLKLIKQVSIKKPLTE